MEAIDNIRIYLSEVYGEDSLTVIESSNQCCVLSLSSESEASDIRIDIIGCENLCNGRRFSLIKITFDSDPAIYIEDCTNESDILEELSAVISENFRVKIS